MGEIVAIVGASGQGKSTSMRNLDPKETFIINVIGKPLPFKGAKKNYPVFDSKHRDGNLFNSSNYKQIEEVVKFVSLKRPEIKNIVIDDFQYVMSTEFMNRAYEKSYDKWTEIGRHAWDVIEASKEVRDDITVFFMCHEESIKADGVEIRKIKTVGKLLDNYITLEGLFRIVLFTEVRKEPDKDTSDYYFCTQSDGSTTAKSPMEMFDSLLIPNDLTKVIEAIENY